MRQRNSPKGLIFSILVSGLLTNFGISLSYASGAQKPELNNTKIEDARRELNELENAFEELHEQLFELSIDGLTTEAIDQAKLTSFSGNLKTFKDSIVELYNKVCTPVQYDSNQQCQEGYDNPDDLNDYIKIINNIDKIRDNLESIVSVSIIFDQEQNHIPKKSNYAEKKFEGLTPIPHATQAIYFGGETIAEENKAILDQRNIHRLGVFFNSSLGDIKNELQELEKNSNIIITAEELEEINNLYPNKNINIIRIAVGILIFFLVVVLIWAYWAYLKNNNLFNTKEQKIDANGQKLDIIRQETVSEEHKKLQEIILNQLRRIENINNSLYKEILANNNETLEKITQLSANISQINANIEQHKDNKDEKLEQISPDKERPSILSTLKNSYELENLLAKYNRNAKVLIVDITKVDPTFESIEERRSGLNTPIILTASENGIYWIVNESKLKDDYYFLVPKAGLVINNRVYQNVEYIFNCKGYQNRASNKFSLVFPAIVKSRLNNEWELVEFGEIVFEEKNIRENNK